MNTTETQMPAEVAEKIQLDHIMEWDPPAALTSARRWTCSTCGDSALIANGVVYGGATERTCAESLAAYRQLFSL